jgi:DNA-binding transcriptional LysR family regulator
VVENSDLLLTMPETYARIIAERGQIEVMSPPAQMPSIDVHLYWHKAYEREPALVWFRDLLRSLPQNQ